MSRPRQFDLICFDWDGTLFDSTAIIVRSIQQAVLDVGGARPSDADAAYVIGMALVPALAKAAPDVPADKYPELAARYRHHYLARQQDISLFEGVLPMLAELRARHHWLTVATGKSRRGLDDVLASLGHVAEGVPTARETLARARALGVDMPITAGVCAMLFGQASPQQVVDTLLERAPKAEDGSELG